MYSYKPPLGNAVFYAEKTYDRVQSQIKSAEADAEPGCQVVVLYFPPGGAEPLAVTDIGFHNPSLLILHCIDKSAQQVRAVVHHTAVQLLLKFVAEQTETPEPKKKSIGFLAEKT